MTDPQRDRESTAGMTWLDDPDASFQRLYNRATFGFGHALSGRALLSLPSLIDLGRRLANHNAAYWSNGPVTVADGWGKGTERPRTLTETLETITENNSLVILKSVVHDPVTGPLMRAVSQAIVEQVGPALRDDLISARASILIASPQRVTAYHIDADVNFLLQVVGDKLFRVYDQNDRRVTGDRELEAYFAGNENGAEFKPEFLDHSVCHRLGPGLGAHVPSLAPHWAQNGDQVSVAISFNYDLRSIAQLGQLYRINRRLRRFGLSPAAPSGGAGDRLKLATFQAVMASRRLGRSPAVRLDPSGWVPR